MFKKNKNHFFKGDLVYIINLIHQIQLTYHCFNILTINILQIFYKKYFPKFGYLRCWCSIIWK